MRRDSIHCEWRQVIIWGAAYFGEACQEILARNDIEILHFVDRTPPPSGRFAGKLVRSSSEFLADVAAAKEADAIIFAMWADPKPMREVLRANGYTGGFATFRGGMGELDLLGQKRSLIVRRIFTGDKDKDGPFLATVADFFKPWSKLALYGAGGMANYLLTNHPGLVNRISVIVDDDPGRIGTMLQGIAVLSPDRLPESDAILITPTRYLDRLDIAHRLAEKGVRTPVWDWESLVAALPVERQPQHAFVDQDLNIYPVSIPPIDFASGKDMILLDPPSRFLGMLPNGLGYVHNILLSTGIDFQTVDLDMIFYHRYHSRRLLDGEEELVSPDGVVLPLDPWAVDAVEDVWYDPKKISYFEPEIELAIERLIAANPKILGLSLHGTNRLIATRIIARMRAERPEMVIVVGGYDCNNPETAPKVIEDYDHMVIFEAENSLPSLVKAILQGKKHFHIPGVISKTRASTVLGYAFTPAELPQDLDAIGFPHYEWVDSRLYRNYNNYQLVPIILSRGCRWSKCNFCGERFNWRRRSPKSVADEIEWFVEQGSNLFHFNDSDLSGDPQAVRGVCEEVVRRGIKGITMVGQLRVQKGYTEEYFHVLSEAGFRNLRYGIDGWSKNTLKLHKKGYTLGMIEEVLGYTKSAGIGVGINLVIGIPHETDADIDETIENMIRNRHNFDIIENLNTLILTTGSVYWTDPEKFGIVLHEDRDTLARKHPVAIPSSLWHSTEPFIDQEVRRNRLYRILEAADEHQIKIGGYANWKVNKIAKEGVPPNERNYASAADSAAG